MTVRLLAALVGLLVLLPTLVYGGQVGVEVLCALVLLVCISEYATMAFPDDRAVAGSWVLVGIVVVYGSIVYAPEIAPLAGMAMTLGTLLWVTLRPPSDLTRAADTAARYLLGIAWMSMLAAFPMLRRLDHGLAWVFLVLVISWLGDTGAYFAGRAFGRTKLYPLISPKKTWEGVVGGVVLATAGVFVVRRFLPELSVIDALLLGPLLCVSGVLGDLAESMLKRAFGVKDAGSIMPGHGGLLDRIDSVLFVAPLLYGYVVVVLAIA